MPMKRKMSTRSPDNYVEAYSRPGSEYDQWRINASMLHQHRIYETMFRGAHHGALIRALCKRYRSGTIIDWGCGQGYLVKVLNRRGIRCIGVDFASMVNALVRAGVSAVSFDDLMPCPAEVVPPCACETRALWSNLEELFKTILIEPAYEEDEVR